MQIKLYKAITSLAFMYGIENWALNRSEREETKITQMLFPRLVSAYTRTLTDLVRNAASV
jgi:hypothetical protein